MSKTYSSIFLITLGLKNLNKVDTIENIRGTAWAGFNAFSEYLDWYGAKQSKQQLVKASSMADATMMSNKGISVPAKQYGLDVLKELTDINRPYTAV